MLDRHRSSWLDRWGRLLAGQPDHLRLGIALAGFVLFIGLSSLVFAAANGWLGQILPAAAQTNGVGGAAEYDDDFVARLERVTDIAKGCFLDVGLSKDHFLTRHTQDTEVGSHRFRFRYWDVWIPGDFSISELLATMRSHRGMKQENVKLEFNEGSSDEKTYTIEVYVDGINTHRMWFTKATQELPEGAKVLLAYLPDDPGKIDFDSLPTVKYKGPPRVAVIIDDIGFRAVIDHLFLTLPAQINLSVLPFGPTSTETAKLAHEKGFEIMLHQPMEPINSTDHDPGRGKLTLNMSEEDVLRTVEQNLAIVPYVKGMNNHMGSAFTRNAAKMRTALEPLKKRNLFFIDSVTIGDSKAYRVAQQFGIRSAARNVFLDVRPDLPSVRRQVELLGRIAQAQGQAIGIGHPFQNTFIALKEVMPKLMAQGVQIVPVSHLVR
ncbi:MAG: divergent polysaccharide deacetylase family protein [Candidatus Lernaella stagnicola]|nr:divergent polysaccharide deacetylase family protein [Candidatus Lernaella stagnicola]